MAIVSLPSGVGEVQQYSGQQGKMPSKAPLAPDAVVPAATSPGEAVTSAAIVPTTTALDMAVAQALGHQNGLAPVFGEAEELAGRSGLPDSVRSAIANLASARLGNGDSEPAASDIVSALRLSGLFHESQPNAAADLKGLLISLRSALIAWVGRSADVIGVAGAGNAAVSDRTRTPPQGRGTPLKGQPSSADTSVAGLDDQALAQRLLDSTDRALWRLFLHQTGQLQADEADGTIHPNRKEGGGSEPLVFELPVAGPSGTSIAALRVEADERRGGDGELVGRVFRVELAFDIAPLGPVTARVGLMPGHRIAVGLWCDGEEATELIGDEREAMMLGLTASGLTVAGIDLHHGQPTGSDEQKAAGRSHRLDLSV